MISDDCEINLLPRAPSAEIRQLKDHLPNLHDYRRDRDRQRREHNLNAVPGNGHWPSLRRRLTIGIILGSFFYLIVSCFYRLDLDKPKFDRSQFKFHHGDRQ
jgi:hypothetical protein